MRIRWIKTFAFLSVIILFATLGLSTSPVSSQNASNGKAELHPNFLILQPASPIDQGRLVNITAILENTGTATANEFKVEFFIRPRSESQTGSWNSFAVDEISGLASQEQEVEARAVLDTSLAMLIPDPNLYEIRVVVDSNDQIPELDEDNNELITSAIIQDSKLGLPDLRATMMMFDPSSPIEEGTSTEVTGMIRNDGDTNAPAFAVQFSHCKVSGTLDLSTCPTEYTPFATVSEPFLGGLTLGGELSARAPLPTLSPGTYLIRMVVDPSDEHHPAGLIEEQDEANNELIVPITIQGSEFHVTGMTFEPVLPRVGDTITVAATVLNSGQEKVANVEVAFYVNGAQFDIKDVSIAGGQSEVVRGTLNTTQLGLEAGKHRIRVVVDPKNLVSERDETNNETRTGLTLLVPIPQLPELRPKGLVLNPSSPVQLGVNPTLNVLVEVLNTGPGSAEDVELEFSYRSTGSLRWIPIQCVTNCSIDRLEPGARFITNADLSLFGVGAGNYEIRAIVDPNEEIAELDEFNNEIKSAFKLLANRLPDLLIDPSNIQFLPSLSERRGTPVTISADVVNFGEANAGPFDVTVSLSRITGENLAAPFVVDTISLDGLDIGGRFNIESQINTNIPPGFYQITIRVDSQERVTELDELNNTFITGPLFVRGPDLTGSMSLVDPETTIFEPTINAGSEITVEANVVNIGVEAAGQFNVEFCYQPLGEDGSEIGTCTSFGETQTFPGLGVGGSVLAPAKLDTTGLETGRYNLKAIIDPVESNFPNGRVEEENEINNRAILTIQVVGDGTGTGTNGGSGADLKVENIDLNPPLAALGQRVDVKAKLKNIGSEDAGPFRVVFFYKRVGQSQMFTFHQVQMTGLPAGEVIWLQGSLLTSLLGTGDFEIIVIADFNNDIKEPDEQNNRMVKNLTVN